MPTPELWTLLRDSSNEPMTDPAKDSVFPRCAWCGGKYESHEEVDITGARGHRINNPSQPQHGQYHAFTPLPPEKPDNFEPVSTANTPFIGVIHLKDWLRRGGKQYISVAGLVSIISAEEILGFKVKGTESNWFTRIVSKTNSSRSINIFGCQIRAIERGEIDDYTDILSL